MWHHQPDIGQTRASEGARLTAAVGRDSKKSPGPICESFEIHFNFSSPVTPGYAIYKLALPN